MKRQFLIYIILLNSLFGFSQTPDVYVNSIRSWVSHENSNGTQLIFARRFSNTVAATATVSGTNSTGQNVLNVTNGSEFSPGQYITVDNRTNQIESISGNALTMKWQLALTFSDGAAISIQEILDTSTAITVNYTVSGSGASEVNISSSSIVIPSGEIFATLNVDPQNASSGADRLVTIDIATGTGYNIASFRSSATISVKDNEAIPAFPTAYGGGAYASGGRAGNVYKVTSLADDGSTGTLRWAVQQPRPATIVFDVSGIINLQSWLTITGSDLTIAGQTAPEGGITITSSNLSRFRMQSSDNMIIRYLRVRPHATPDDAFELYSNTGLGTNIIFDHLSLSYGGDEIFDIRGNNTNNITFQNGFLAEGKTGSLFGDSSTPEFSFNLSFFYSIYLNSSHRVPNGASTGRLDIVNNISYNSIQRWTFVTGDIQLNHLNNFYFLGNLSTYIGSLGGKPRYLVNQLNSVNNNRIYTAGNIVDKVLFSDPLADNKQLWAEFNYGIQDEFADASEFVASQYTLIGRPLPIMTAQQVSVNVPQSAGANAYLNADGSVTTFRDANDTDYLNMIVNDTPETYDNDGGTNGRHTFVDSQRYADFIAGVTGTPINTRPANYDSDNDGMADAWEIANFGNLSRDGTGDFDGDGYTDLEEFLNLVDNDGQPVTPPNPSNKYIPKHSRILPFIFKY